MNAQKLAMDST